MYSWQNLLGSITQVRNSEVFEDLEIIPICHIRSLLPRSRLWKQSQVRHMESRCLKGAGKEDTLLVLKIFSTRR